MDVEVPELSGHLIVPTQTGFSLNRISKKKSSSHKYCLLFRASRHGIERLEICDSRDDTRTPKIITLENCVKITHEPAPALLIHIVTKTDTLTLNALTADDLKLWLAALQSVAFRDKAAAAAAAAAAAHRQTPNSASIEEDNDLYCSSYVDDGCFVVRLVPSDASQKCALSAHRTYVLHLTATDLQLKCADDSSQQIPAAASATPSAGPSSTSTAATTPTSGGGSSANIVTPINQPIGAVAAKWPYRYIRKYGYRDGKFTFEAGRKCETGEGVFSLEHPHPLEVFRCMTAKMKTMKKLISGDSMTSLDCGEHQFNAALSMEAGSRSPLPPSPNHHSTHMMLGGGGCATDSSAPVSVDSTHSGLLLRGFLSSNDSLMSAGSGSMMSQLSGASTPQIKAVPSKPPRKSIGTMLVDHLGGKYHKFQNYEHVSPPPTSQNLNTSVGDSSSGGALTNTDLSGNKTPSATIILKTPPAADSHKTFHLSLATTPEHGVGERSSECPPKLPVRNESKSNSMTSGGGGSDDYECVKTITNAWRTHGLNDVRHTEQRFGVGAATPVRTNLPLPPVPQQQQQQVVRTQQQQPLSADSDAELTDYVWQRSQSQKEPSSGGNRRHSPPHSAGGKQLQTTVSVSAATTTTMLSPEDDYDRLQFFGPNKTATAGNSNSSLNSNSQNGGSCSSDYKTIITVTSPGYKKQTSLPAVCNDYEVIGAGNSATPTATTTSVGKRSLLDLQLTKSRMADDSFAGYGVLRKSAGSGGLVEVQPTAATTAASPSHAQHYHPELSYAIVSKPKRV